MGRWVVAAWCVVMLAAQACCGEKIARTVTIAPGVEMPRVSLGTCCGSQPKIGLDAWLKAGGRGVDSAYDYGKTVSGGLQSEVRKVLEASGVQRKDVFITTKIPAGLGFFSGFCVGGSKKALAFVKQDLRELGIEQADLVLLHAPCLLRSNTQALWRGKLTLDE